MYSPEMPPLVDGPPPFIPPPQGASNGGQPGFLDAFPGARDNQQTTSYWPAQGTPYPPFQQSLPNWPDASQPTSAQSWTFGQYPAAAAPAWPPAAGPQTPVWGQTPATSWGTQTPGGTWGGQSPASYVQQPRTPISAPNPYPPWLQAPVQQPGFFSPQRLTPTSPYDMAFGQPMAVGWGGLNAAGYPVQLLTPQKKPKTKRPDSTGPPAMRRSSSQGPSPRRPPLQRSASFGQPNQMGYAFYSGGDTYDEDNLARRPRDWRPDYSPRPGLTSYIPLVGKNHSTVQDYSDPIRRVLHPLLHHTPPYPPVHHDLRCSPFNPEDVEFPNIGRAHNDIDFAQLVMQPSCSFMRLYHPKLPWYIDVHQTHPNGVMVNDVFTVMHNTLHTPILQRHYWNEEMSSSDRAVLNQAFQERCKNDPELVKRGVLKVDFLGKKVIFEGLVRGPKGLWEIKLSKG